MPSPQDAVFSALHTELLKPLGFRKASNRSELSLSPLHQAVACHSSRFNSSQEIEFTLELRVGHEAFLHLYQPGAAFPGLGERSFMPLLSWRLTEDASSNEKWWRLRGGAKLEAVQEEVLRTFRLQGLPALQQTRTVEGIAEFCKSRPLRAHFQAYSWALYHLGLHADARAVVQEAIRSAPHENARTHARSWLAKIDA